MERFAFHELTYQIKLFISLIPILRHSPKIELVVNDAWVTKIRTNHEFFEHGAENVSFKIWVIEDFASFDGYFLGFVYCSTEYFTLRPRPHQLMHLHGGTALVL